MIFEYAFDAPTYKGTSKIPTGLFIGGKFVEPIEGGKIDIINPATGKLLTSVSGGSKADVDLAVEIANKAFKESWGLKVPGSTRGRLLNKLADLVEQNADEFAALESLSSGRSYMAGRTFDVIQSIESLRYYAGWADKVQGKTIETTGKKFAYTRREPYGTAALIVPWNFPFLITCWKLGPALACGNTVILKPSEFTPLTALKLATLVNEAGFPPGVINIVNGYGNTVGQAIAEHPHIPKISFTGGTLTGRKIQEASSRTNLKVVTLELGGKNPSIIFDDANLEQAVKWSTFQLFAHQGQVCTSGSRILVQEGIYDVFLAAFTKAAEEQKASMGDPFGPTTLYGPQVSEVQFNKIMGYIESGKQEGASLRTGGVRHGTEGYFIEPTVFADCKPEMKIVQEEIFGPVGAVIKFKTEEEAIDMANNTSYGLASSVFTENISKALRVAHALEAGTAWINSHIDFDTRVAFGGYKQSGHGKELGEDALDSFTHVKAVHVNLGLEL